MKCLQISLCSKFHGVSGRFFNFLELHWIFKAEFKPVMWVLLIPCILLHVCVPMLTTATSSILVDPARAIVPLTPCAVPPLSILSLPPCLPLFHPMPIWIESLVPFVTPFCPCITLWPFRPFICIFHAAALPVILLTPPARVSQMEKRMYSVSR